MASVQLKDEDLYPQSFVCPLTLQVMKDPVVDTEGNSYERTAIENWLEKNQTSPVTRNPLSKNDLVPNRALREAIEDKHKEIASGKAVPVEKNELSDEERKKGKNVNKNKNVEEQLGNDASVTVSVTGTHSKEDATVLVSIKPPSGSRTPCDICCVVDVSGSMSTEATMQNAKGDKEAHGLSLLDIVKHAVKTIINVLQPNDRLSIVSYSSNAKVVLDLTAMDDQGKTKAQKELDSLTPDGQTNLWDGLHTGLEVLRNSSSKGRLSSVMLLTDGQPNVIPPRGHLPMLQKYKDENQLSSTINTFGFGYSLDSELLKDFAIEGHGMYAFIPDSGFVGTAFVNATSNLLSSMAKNVQLSLEPLNGASIVEKGVLGGFPTQYASWGASVTLGSIQYEQAKNLVLRMKVPNADKPYLRAILKFETKSGQKIECSAEGNGWDGSLAAEVEANYNRLIAVDAIIKAVNSMKADSKLAVAQKIIGEAVSQIRSTATSKSDSRVQALLQDLEGQVTEAFSKSEFYTKWGVHYLPSLVNAHQLQMCNNFKDPGVQLYGGKLFQELRNRADDIFVKLPPPKPSIKHSSSHRVAPVSNMAVYHNHGNACFDGNCMVTMADGSFKQVKHITKGDKVMAPFNKVAEVVCVLKTACKQDMADLVELQNGLLLTPYHPVKVNGRWEFPINLAQVTKRSCEAVYSFVLKEEHIMLINGVECVSLGHQFQEDVVRHAYFGSQRVIEDLKKMRGWNTGFIEATSGLIRDNITGLVCGIIV